MPEGRGDRLLGAPRCAQRAAGVGPATWTRGADDDRVIVTWRIDGQDGSAELHIGPDGRLLGVLVQRWGDSQRGTVRPQPSGVAIEADRISTGVTIGSMLRAGWWWERTDGGKAGSSGPDHRGHVRAGKRIGDLVEPGHRAAGERRIRGLPVRLD